MPCKDHVWKIGPYVDGELPVGERDEVEVHLQECPDCTELASEFCALDSLAGRDEVPAVTGEEWSRMLSHVTLESRVDRKGTRRRAWEWLVPVASVAALLLFAVFVGPSLLDPTNGLNEHEAKNDGKTQPVVIDGSDEDELNASDRALRSGGTSPSDREVLER